MSVKDRPSSTMTSGCSEVVSRSVRDREITGSIPVTPTSCTNSSVGRAAVLHIAGQGFETLFVHYALGGRTLGGVQRGGATLSGEDPESRLRFWTNGDVVEWQTRQTKDLVP